MFLTRIMNLLNFRLRHLRYDMALPLKKYDGFIMNMHVIYWLTEFPYFKRRRRQRFIFIWRIKNILLLCFYSTPKHWKTISTGQWDTAQKLGQHFLSMHWFSLRNTPMWQNILSSSWKPHLRRCPTIEIHRLRAKQSLQKRKFFSGTGLRK